MSGLDEDTLHVALNIFVEQLGSRLNVTTHLQVFAVSVRDRESRIRVNLRTIHGTCHATEDGLVLAFINNVKEDKDEVKAGNEGRWQTGLLHQRNTVVEVEASVVATFRVGTTKDRSGRSDGSFHLHLHGNTTGFHCIVESGEDILVTKSVQLIDSCNCTGRNEGKHTG